MTLKNACSTLVCLFQSLDAAQGAAAALEGRGIPRDGITVIDPARETAPHGLGRASVSQRLAPANLREADRKHVEEAIHAGQAALVVQAPEERRGEVEHIFERFRHAGPVASTPQGASHVGASRRASVRIFDHVGDPAPVAQPPRHAVMPGAGEEIVLSETAEVPVVHKVARVVEEVHVSKVDTQHPEVVHDNVRHTEVEVHRVGTRSGRPPVP